LTLAAAVVASLVVAVVVAVVVAAVVVVVVAVVVAVTIQAVARLAVAVPVSDLYFGPAIDLVSMVWWVLLSTTGLFAHPPQTRCHRHCHTITLPRLPLPVAAADRPLQTTPRRVWARRVWARRSKCASS
jgi:hypothetical protein